MREFLSPRLLVAPVERSTTKPGIMLRVHACLVCPARQVFVAVILFGLFSVPTAHALIFDEIVVKSRIGEPLLVYIPFSPDSPNEKVTKSCLSLIKSDGSFGQEDLDLSSVGLEVEGNEKMGQQIKIFTSAPVNAHSLTFQLRANCVLHGLVIREFNFELEQAAAPFLRQPESSSVPAEKIDVNAMQNPSEKNVLQELDLSGSVRGGYFSSSRKLDGENALGTGSLWLKAAENFGEDTSLVARGWVRNDESFRAGGGSETLQEGYLQFSSGKVDYRIGKQIIAWGRADRLNPTDNLTPRNYTLLTPEDDDQRIGSLAAKITYYSQENSLTGIWLPKMDPNVIPVAATPGTFITEHIPHASQFALKFDQSGGDVDWSVSYYNGLDLNPDIAIGATTSSGTNLTFEHNRIHVLGMDAATVMGRYGLRAEAAYTWTANVDANDFLVKKPFLYMVMGGDRTFFDYLNVNIQYYLRHVTNYSDPQVIADPLLRSVAIQGAVLSNQFDRTQHGISIRVSDKWFNETLEGEIAAVATLRRSNYFIRPKLTYAFSDSIKGSFGLDIYRGDSNTLFGLLRDSSLFFAEMKYGF